MSIRAWPSRVQLALAFAHSARSQRASATAALGIFLVFQAERAWTLENGKASRAEAQEVW
jgi:hypothetical protein